MATMSSFLPSPLLADYIENFSVFEGEAELSPGRERRLPDGRVALVINLGHDTLRACAPGQGDQLQSFYGGILHGAFSQASIIDATSLVTTISVNFKPGGVLPFLPLPASELTNQVVDLATLWGAAAIDMREQVLLARTKVEQVHIIERFLLARVDEEQMAHPAIEFALTQFLAGQERPSISEVRTQLGLPPKRFIHLFEQAVGLTPKVFCRLLRFQEVLRHIQRGQNVRWTDIALSCGYFDQAHFIHDFQSFAELTPSAYLALRGEHHNHVPLPD